AGLLRSTAVFSAMTFISRITGLVRDQVYAAVFGANPAMDAFLVAFRIPNFLRRLSAEGSFSMAFVPVLSEYRERRDHAAVKELVDRVAGTLLAVLLVLTALAVLAAPWVIRLFAPGFDAGGEQGQLAAEMLRITFPYLLFISMASLAGGVLNSYRQFAVPALSPVLMNVAMISAALVLTALAVLAAPWVIRLFAPGFDAGGEQGQLAAEMLRITFPYLLFISMASLAGGVLNSYRQFAVPALSPVLMNVAMISAALALAPRMEQPVMALAWGVFAAGILQLVFHLP